MCGCCFLSFFQIFKKLIFPVCLKKTVTMLSKTHAAERNKDKAFPYLYAKN